MRNLKLFRRRSWRRFSQAVAESVTGETCFGSSLGFAAGCEGRAMPPKKTLRLTSPLRYGFAAGCEGWLCLQRERKSPYYQLA